MNRGPEFLEVQRFQEKVIRPEGFGLRFTDRFRITGDNDDGEVRIHRLRFKQETDAGTPLDTHVGDEKIEGVFSQSTHCIFYSRYRDHRAVFLTEEILERRENVHIIIEDKYFGKHGASLY